MNRTKLLMGVLLLFLIFPGLVFGAESVGKFSYIKGRVDITSPGESARPASVGDEVYVGDIVRSKSGSKAEITFMDGNVLRLAQSTRVKISDYMVGKEERRGILSLFRGKIQSIVKRVTGRIFGYNQRNRFEVHTPTAVLGVRGTNFWASYLRGISYGLFMVGDGYCISRNRPDAIQYLGAGQSVTVFGADMVPVIGTGTEARQSEKAS